MDLSEFIEKHPQLFDYALNKSDEILLDNDKDSTKKIKASDFIKEKLGDTKYGNFPEKPKLPHNPHIPDEPHSGGKGKHLGKLGAIGLGIGLYFAAREAKAAEAAGDHERAKEALSAIAAASTRKEEEGAAAEPAPTKKRRTRAVSTEVKEPEASSVEQVAAPEAPAEESASKPAAEKAEESATKRPRRRRRVAESAPLPELPVRIDLPEPVDHSDEPAAPTKDASEIQLPEHREKAPATRRHVSRKAATASSDEPAEAPAPKKTRRRVTAQTAVPEVQTDETPATAPVSASVAEETSVQEPAAPRKTRRRRVAVSTGIVEPDAAPTPVVIDLPARAEVSVPAVPTKSTDDIALPEASDQPRVKRRRRAASTGIVDAG